MAQGWHGNSEGHARAGRLGGQKSAANRRARAKAQAGQFGEQINKNDSRTRAMRTSNATGKPRRTSKAATD